MWDNYVILNTTLPQGVDIVSPPGVAVVDMGNYPHILTISSAKISLLSRTV